MKTIIGIAVIVGLVGGVWFVVNKVKTPNPAPVA